MILTVQKDSYLPAELPMKFEAGTPNIAGVVAFAIALEYLRQAGLSNIHQHEQEIVRYAVEEMKRVQGVTLYGTSDFASRGGVVSFNVDGVHPHDVGSILDEEGIAVRAGHHCCEPFMRKLDISGTVRASFYLYNGPEDVDALIRGIKRVKEIFKK
jgi:cysteine desulfurase/selenocysteine lyase